MSNVYLEKYIIKIPNFISNDLCDSIVKEFINSNEWTFGAMGGRINPYVRSCSFIDISNENVINKNYEARKTLDKKICDGVFNALNSYVNIFPTVSVSRDHGYNLLRYETGQYIKSHVDGTGTEARELSFSIGLNDEYTGGEFYFKDLNKTIRLNKGDIIMFPSNFMFPHEILTVTSGTRYSIITWLG